jgi:hypothetical protein
MKKKQLTAIKQGQLGSASATLRTRDRQKQKVEPADAALRLGRFDAEP